MGRGTVEATIFPANDQMTKRDDQVAKTGTPARVGRRAFLKGVPTAVAGVGPLAAGFGVFWIRYDEPERHAQSYRHWDGTVDYYFRGRKVTQQEYDYYLLNGSNLVPSVLGAVPAGFGVTMASLGCFWLIARRMGRSPTLERLIGAFAAVDVQGGSGVDTVEAGR